jgi:hypothetical protein
MSIPENDIHLAEPMTVYFHDYENTNWNHESYELLFTVKTVGEFWTIFNTLKEKISMGMFFFMKGSTFPKWESAGMTERYTFASAKVLKPKSIEFMEQTLVSMLSNTLHKTLPPQTIRGVSISPKKHFCIVKAWIKSNTGNTADIVDESLYDFPHMYHGSILFRDS